jgi:hypothetical protein
MEPPVKVVEPEEPYYDEFDRVTNNGRVFATDLSVVRVLPPTLLPVEIEERNDWRTSRQALLQHYDNDIFPRRHVNSREQLLEERVAPPLLAGGRPSTRNRSQERVTRNPSVLHVWAGFRQAVNQFQPTNPQAAPELPISDVFKDCIREDVAAANEADEKSYLTRRKLFYKNAVRAGRVSWAASILLTNLYRRVGTVEKMWADQLSG